MDRITQLTTGHIKKIQLSNQPVVVSLSFVLHPSLVLVQNFGGCGCSCFKLGIQLEVRILYDLVD